MNTMTFTSVINSDEIMEFSLKSIIFFAAVLLTGLSAGFFLAWTVSVIPGTKRVLDITYLETMQSINRAILNPAFFVIFFGTIGFLSLSSIYELHANNSTFWLFLGASVIYLLGTIGITMFGNVPLNNELDILNLADVGSITIEEFRLSYEGKWNRLHYWRTAFAMLSFVLSVLGYYTYSHS